MATYQIDYSCGSNIGLCRKNNQDNYICLGQYRDLETDITEILTGTTPIGKECVFGVFDGLGGEEFGEIASLIAAKRIRNTVFDRKLKEKASAYCVEANKAICDYADENEIFAMGTTAAFMVFAKKEILLCNIGDSRIYFFSDDKMEQISYDHVLLGTQYAKPPLTQKLGIREEELVLDPFFSSGTYREGDVFLICSDGLTDMVPLEEIKEIVLQEETQNCASVLIEKALENGGRDNTTVIVCKVIGKSKKRKETKNG